MMLSAMRSHIHRIRVGPPGGSGAKGRRAVRRGGGLAAAGLALLLLGCQSPGPVDNPMAQSLTWFGYMDGQDIRGACGRGGPDRLRFVYNGTWDSQVRTYDVTASGAGARVAARVLGQGNIASVNITGFNLLAPWEATKSVTEIDGPAYGRLLAALMSSGFAEPAPRGRWLRSDAYFWTVAACLDGRYHWNAWASDWPRSSSNTIEHVAFAQDLIQADRTGIAYRAPQPQQLSNWDSGGDRRGGFRLQVGANGLVLGPQF